MNGRILPVRLLAWAGIGLCLAGGHALIAQQAPQPAAAATAAAGQPERRSDPASRSCGARSARRTWAAASTTSRSTKTTRPPSMSASPPAASGRPRTTARPGRRSSTSIPVSSIGDIALAPSNPDIIYVGTGEPNNRQSSSFGAGVYKSTDGGKEFVYVGLKETQSIGRVVVHPKDPNIVYVAAVGHLFGPNPERGLYKTTDGGKTWTNTKFIDNDTGFTDVVMDPVEPERAVRRVVSAPAPAVGLQRRRAGQRHLEDDRRREDLDEAHRQRPARQSDHRPHRPRHRPLEAVDDLRLDRSRPERRHRRRRQRRRHARAARAGPRRRWRRRTRTGRRLLPIRRRAASGARTTAARPGSSCRTRATAGCTTARSASIPTNPEIAYQGGAPFFKTRRRRQERGGRSAASRTAITTRSGSIRRTTTTSCSATTADSTCRTTRARRGSTSTRWRSASSTRSAPTCGSRTTSAAACRTTAAGAARAASRSANGILNSDWFRVGGGDGFYTANDPTDWRVLYSESQDGDDQPHRAARTER